MPVKRFFCLFAGVLKRATRKISVEVVRGGDEKTRELRFLEMLIRNRALGQFLSVLKHPSSVNQLPAIHQLVKFADAEPVSLREVCDLLAENFPLTSFRMNQHRQESVPVLLGMPVSGAPTIEP